MSTHTGSTSPIAQVPLVNRLRRRPTDQVIGPEDDV